MKLSVINVFLQYYSHKYPHNFSLDQFNLIIGPELCPGVLLLFESSVVSVMQCLASKFQDDSPTGPPWFGLKAVTAGYS